MFVLTIARRAPIASRSIDRYPARNVRPQQQYGRTDLFVDIIPPAWPLHNKAGTLASQQLTIPFLQISVGTIPNLERLEVSQNIDSLVLLIT